GGPPGQTSTDNPRAPVPTPSPDEDPRRLDLHHGRTRCVPLDQPARPHLATRPHRHHRPHPSTRRPTRPTTGRPTTPTNQLTPTRTPRRPRPISCPPPTPTSAVRLPGAPATSRWAT